MFFYRIPQAHVMVVERLGKFHRICQPGLRVLLPILDYPKEMPEWEGRGVRLVGSRPILVELAEQSLGTEPRASITRDNVQLRVDTLIYWQVTDVMRAVYEVDVLPNAILDLTLTTLRSVIGSMNMDEAISNRLKINDAVQTELQGAVEKWGVRVNRVEIQELHASDEASAAMLKQMTAEREKRAAVTEAEGKKAAAILEAEGYREAVLIRSKADADAMKEFARGEAEFLKPLHQVLGEKNGMNFALAAKYLRTLGSMDETAKVFLPLNLAEAIDTVLRGTGKK